jgi:hypothetical protein
MASLSVATLLAGLLWPHLAATFLQALVAALALGYMGARTHRSSLPTALSSDAYSPFDAVTAPSRAPTSPPAVVHLTTLLQAVMDPEAARRALIPADARRILEAEASRRLAEHHGLSPLRPADLDRIRSLVSDATLALLRAAPMRDAGSATLGSIPMSRLESILDDVERL